MDLLTSTTAWLATEAAGLQVWGAYSRLLGLMYAIALLALVPQLVPLAGKRGMNPLSPMFAAAWRTYGVQCLWWFPSLYWLSTHDLMLVLVPAVGGLSGLAVFLYGGPWSPSLLFVCWACMLSIDSGPIGLGYPWDCLLLESGFLALFLPASTGTSWLTVLQSGSVHSLLAVQCTTLPSALLGFAHRWLLFRLLFGFGKLKFTGSGWHDRYYIKSFMITQPMPSPLGYWAYKLLPDVAWIFFLAGMFVVEIIAPWFLLAPWPTGRVLAALSIQGLMVGIQAGGNFGYFNVLTATIAIPCLFVGPGSSLSWSISDAFPLAMSGHTFFDLCVAYPAQAAFFFVAILVTVPCGCVQLIMNSWVNLSWFYWPNVRRVRSSNAIIDTLVVAPGRALAAWLRFMGQFKIIQAYGVFPPSMGPAQRWACLYEVSSDKVHWTRLEYAKQQSNVHTPPRFIAPYHPRIDHAVFYESLCMNGQNFMCSLASAHPLGFPSSSTNWQRLQARLAEACQGSRFGSAPGDIHPNGLLATLLWSVGLGHVASSHPVLWFFRSDHTRGNVLPPGAQHVRMIACHYLPVPGMPKVNPSTGKTQYWTEEYMDMHLEPYSADEASTSADSIVKSSLPLGPYDVWPESIHWLWKAAHYSWPLAGESSLQLTATQLSHLQMFHSALLEAASSTGTAATHSTHGDQPGAPSAKKRRGSRHSAAAASTLMMEKGLPAKTMPLTSADAVSQSFISLPPKQCPKVCDKTPAPLRDLSWSTLPVVHRNLHKRLGDHGLAVAQEALGRLTVPLLLALDVLFGRLPPSADQLKAAVLDCQGKIDAAGASFIATLLIMVEGVPEDSTLLIAEAQGLPSTTADGRPIHYYAGNDDAGLPGCMRNSLRWSFFLHAIFIQQGVDGLAKRLQLLQQVVGSLHDPSFPSRLQKANLFALWRAIIEPPDENMAGLLTVHPTGVPTEAGSSILFLLFASVVRAHAAGHARLLAQSAPMDTRQATSAFPHFLPAIVDLLPRLAAYPGLAAVGRPADRALPTLTAWVFNKALGQWTYAKEHGSQEIH